LSRSCASSARDLRATRRLKPPARLRLPVYRARFSR
jgi:hypothetical protein